MKNKDFCHDTEKLACAIVDWDLERNETINNWTNVVKLYDIRRSKKQD